MFSRKKERFEPDLIDLVEYEKILLYRKKHGKPAIPLLPIPNLFHIIQTDKPVWTDSELQYMRDNREQARAIKREIYGE